MFNFPSSGLTVGEIINGPGGQLYEWDGVKWIAGGPAPPAPYVLKAGDTMTGPLNIQSGGLTVVGGAAFNNLAGPSGPAVTLSGPAGGGRTIVFATGATQRWRLIGADSAGEIGGNAGSNFSINRYTDAGALIDQPLTIQRSSGALNATGQVILTYTGAALFAPGALAIDAPPAIPRSLDFTTSGSLRWQFFMNTVAESGTSSGADWGIARFSNTGAFIDAPLSIARASGLVTINDGLYVTAGGITTNTNVNINGPLTVAGSMTVTGPATAVTPPHSDNSTNIATTAFVRNIGIQSAAQEIISATGAYNLTSADAGRNLLIGSTVTQLNFPATGFDATCTFSLSSYPGNAPISLNFATGSDFRTILYAGEKVILSGDGGGFFRVVATGVTGNQAPWTSWTPALQFGGAAAGLTYGARTGSFQVSGRLCTLMFDFTLSAKGTSTGNATISGLPVPMNGVYGLWAGAVFPATQMANLTGPVIGSTFSGGAGIGLFTNNAAGLVGLTDANFTPTSVLNGLFIYAI